MVENLDAISSALWFSPDTIKRINKQIEQTDVKTEKTSFVLLYFLSFIVAKIRLKTELSNLGTLLTDKLTIKSILYHKKKDRPNLSGLKRSIKQFFYFVRIIFLAMAVPPAVKR